jgi:SPP1 family predicted phage head-tail adaptor
MAAVKTFNRAGKYDRRIVIQHRPVVQDETYGVCTDGEWEDFATVWSEVQDLLPSRGEMVVDGIDIGRRPCRIRMRYRSDITSQMRVHIGDRVLRIVSMPAELGRREAIEFVAEELTTEGQEP